MSYRLVRRDGVDTLHRWPALEQCNLDDTDRDEALKVSSEDAAKLIVGGSADPCGHCQPLEPDVRQPG